jgi:DNA-binding Lrp family transcriptional regulator
MRQKKTSRAKKSEIVIADDAVNKQKKADRKKKKPAPVLDEKDRAIIHFLEQRPGVLLKNLPNELEAKGGSAIPYPTLQRRMKLLMSEGREVVKRIFSVNWAAAGYMVRYRVGILVDPVALRGQSIEDKEYDSQNGLADYIMNVLAQDERFKNKLVVDDVYILLGGRVDLAVDFCARDDKTATLFIIDALRKLPGISNTASAKLAYSSKHKWLSENGDEDGDKADART